VKWASVTLVALLLTGCANSRQALQDRPSNTKAIRKQAAASEPQYAYTSLLTALQQWGERVTWSMRSAQALRACQETLISAATPFRPQHVQVVGAGLAKRTRQGVVTIPLEARVTYARSNGTEVRQGRITCRLNDSNIVLALRES
jgi:hypothetical protein